MSNANSIVKIFSKENTPYGLGMTQGYQLAQSLPP